MGRDAGIASALATHEVVGARYRIELQLGRGATASVYRVRDERSGKKLALKRFAFGDGGSAFHASQFEREYHTLCQLAHPSIIEVYDYGVDAVGAFYTMELLDGQDLRERGKLPWREACALLRDIASSLAVLHSRRLLHRDVSARNVRCTSDGRAKLIDFGAMMAMGLCKQTVGTPPFVPPEALQLQALDARADLYALGALGYHMLTGNYAYPVRSMEQLRDAWRRNPPHVRALAPEVPEALERLITQLTHLDRMARPSSAAEVMERLSGIAGLPLQERSEVTRAYLVTPVMVGREALLHAVRAELVRAGQGRGGCVLIEGASGTGRSRVLDACVLDAKLLGAQVLRGDAADSASGDYGLARALCRQLADALPQIAAQHAGPHRRVLAHLLPQLAAQGGAPRRPPERRHLHVALRDFVLSVARQKRIVIAVDDVEAVDEPSAALLAALAHGAARRELALLLATDVAQAHTRALSLVREIARVFTLEPLSADSSEALVRSVFGDVDHVVAIAERIHGLSQGNPRATMALLQHLVERGVARYEAGSFTLPSRLAPGDLPESLSAGLAARVAALPQDARELAEVLAHSDPAVFLLQDYPQLTAHRDHGRSYRALDALLSSGVLVTSGERQRFAQSELLELLRAGVTGEQQRALHARIAQALEHCEDVALLSHHLLLGGREREAIERLLPLRTDPRFAYSAFALSLLERAADAAQRLELPLRVVLDIRVWLLNVAAQLGHYAVFARDFPAVLARFEQDSGLTDYAALPETLPAAQRVQQAFAAAKRRYAALSDHERGLPPIEALKQLARLCSIVVTMTSIVQDLELIERLPSLWPFAPFAPALEVAQLLVDGQLDFQAGRVQAARGKYMRALARVQQPDHAGLDLVHYNAVRLGASYMQGVIGAARGQASVHEWVSELEQAPGHRVNAWRVRMTYELTFGDLEAARDCERRAELFALQDGELQRYPGSTSRIELLALVHCENLIGVKRTMERIAALAARYPCWRPTLDIARAQYHLLQGDHASALEAVLPALTATAPGRHLDWGFAAATHVAALTALGRLDEAVAHGRAYWAQSQRAQLSPSYRGVARTFAEALIRAGHASEGGEIADHCIRETLADDTHGIMLGAAYETRARAAIALRDEAEFRRYAELCAHEFRRGLRQALRARYERLLREAESAGLCMPREQPRELDLHTLAPAWTESARTAHSRLLECAGAGERAQTALRLLLEATGAACGHLFGLRDGRLSWLASSDASAPEHALFGQLEGFLHDQLEAGGAATELGVGPAADSSLSQFVDARRRAFEPLLIESRRSGENVIGAIAALHYEDRPFGAPGRALLETLADALLENDDVDAVTCAL